MSFSKEFINKIKLFGVSKYARQYTQLFQNGLVFSGRCPHPDHNDEDPSFNIWTDPKTGLETWCCMGCHNGKKDDKTNFGSDNIAFVRWMSANSKSNHVKTFPEALIELAEFYGMPIEQDIYRAEYMKNRNLAISWFQNLCRSPQPFQYLKERGVEMEDISKWAIGFNGERITFPILNRTCDVIGFSNRIFPPIPSKIKGKYINSRNSEIFNKSKLLYGIQYYNNNSKYILVVEGQFDVILAHKYGLNYTVGTMTCHLSDYHINTIKSMGKVPILCYDNDEAGQNGLNSALNALYDAGITDSRILILPKGKDMADIALDYKEELPKYVNEHTVTYSQYQLENLATIMDRKITELQNTMYPQIERVLNGIRNPQEKAIAKNFIQRRLRLWV